MQRLFFEKQIDLNHALQALLSISVHENLAYQDDSEGKRAVGNLEIDGDYLRGGQKEHFHDQIEMDVLAPFDRLEDDTAFHLEVQDFDYHIQNGNLNLEIQVMAHGVGEKKERHIIIDSTDEDEQAVLEEIQNIISKKELMDTLEEHLLSDEEEAKTDHQEVLLEDDSQTVLTDCSDEEAKRTDLTGEAEQAVISEEVSDISLEDEDILAAEVISEDFAETEQTIAVSETDVLDSEAKEAAAKPVQETKAQIESVQPDLPTVEDWQDNDSVDVEDLFDDDDMAFVTYPIYVVQAGDTYQSIADRYELEAEDLMDYNHRMSLQPHQLLVIPPR